MVKRLRLAALGLCGAALGHPFPAPARAGQPPCALRNMAPATAGQPSRSLRAEDLVRITDIGDPSPAFDSGGLSLSPNGRFLAFPIRRADPGSNSYCLALVRLDLRGTSGPILLDTGGGLVGQETGGARHAYPLVVRPRWSPDGAWIAFEKNVGGTVRLWRARTDGGGVYPVKGSREIVEDFQWVDDDTIVTRAGAGVVAAERAVAREARTGFHYDERFAPNRSDRPLPPAAASRAYRVIDVRTGVVRQATTSERALLAPAAPPGALRVAQGTGGARAWISRAYPDRFGPASDLHVQFPGMVAQTCGPALCDRIEGLWWSAAGGALVFVQREGWADSKMGVYLWDRGAAAPHKILVTDDLLIDCQLAGTALVCGHERARQPRTIVSIALQDGSMRTLYDPNPGFAQLSLGRVERLYWKNANGFEVFGDLVYPVGFAPGVKYPLIVTTYTSRGFLRGATGDEFPIQLFANHGYAVLSFSRPREVGVGVPGLADPIAAQRLAYTDWADRRSVQSAIEQGLKLLDVKGMIDRSRVGITGLSDGSTTVQFALLNSNLFSAAATGSCCLDAQAMLADSGLASADFFRATGYPSLDQPQSRAWSDMSFTLSPERLRAPLLMQLGSDEFRWALASFTTLRDHRRPVDMYVFPDEGHIKLQPAHRLAIYRRNLAWFDFWLKGAEDGELVGAGELERWRGLRALATDSGKDRPGPG